MANKVSNLVVKLQTGTDSTYYATWEFDPNFTITNTVYWSGGIKVGDWVTIKDSAHTWYNGASIPSWVRGQEWRVIELIGTRAVLNENRSGSNHIMSPIDVNNLNGGSGGGSSTTSETVMALDHYEVEWAYDSGDGIWFDGGSSNVTEKLATYNGPSNALKIRCTVKPVAKTRKVNGQDTPYYTGSKVSYTYQTSVNPPEDPPAPQVEIEDFTLTALVDNVSDARTEQIEFQVYDLTTFFSSGISTVTAARASFTCSVNAGGRYRVRARSINLVGGGKTYSDWTDFTNEIGTIPSTPSGITTIRGSSSTSVYLEWASVNSAETYDIEYTTNVNYFDASSEVTSITGVELTHYEVTGLDSGDEYFFRVRAVNEQGESGWTEVKSVVIGKKPSAPTTWSSTTTAIVGTDVYLYWVHNSEDNSREHYAEVEVTIGEETNVYTVENKDADNDDAEVKTRYYLISTAAYSEGTKIQWRVRTAGVTLQYGDWSMMRTVDIYAPPTLSLSITNQNGDILNTITEFPFYIKGLAGPATQYPIGYSVTITADVGYESFDDVGNATIVSPGDEIYSSYIDSNNALLLEMQPWTIDLQANVTYTLSVIVSMNSGLTATETLNFGVSWEDVSYTLDAAIAIDEQSYVAYITPYCRDADDEIATDVYLAVYRREFNGTYTEIASRIDPLRNTMVTDPHPALDYARYRIVAISNATGSVSYYDTPSYPVGCTDIIVQWAEEWQSYDVVDPDSVTLDPLWSGSMVHLPWNIDVSEDTVPEATLVKYIGREYPVSYYGTQIDTTATWTSDIPRNDAETLYALRRLAVWKGDVYVREPSGSGYWANVSVSFNKTYSEMVIPVTLSITRVEGGM